MFFAVPSIVSICCCLAVNSSHLCISKTDNYKTLNQALSAAAPVGLLTLQLRCAVDVLPLDWSKVIRR